MDGIAGEMSFNNKRFIEEIKIEKVGEKLWTLVRFNDGKIWIPALIEQGILAQDVANCELTKYGNSIRNPKRMPGEFLIRAIKGENICMLAHIYKLTHTRAYKKFCLERNINARRPHA